MGVLPGAVRDTIRIDRGDEPEILTGMDLAKGGDDGQPGAFVAVDTTDDQHPRPRAGDVHELDRPG